jgi:methionyl-tRNA formyltransferase
MGTPDFAVPALETIIKARFEVVGVYTQPPRPKGRGQQVQISPVQACAEKNNIPVFYPKILKNTEAQAEFSALKPDVAVVAAYGLILPKAILDAPPYGCLNIHASLLPRWRGAAPIQYAILAGDHESGITIMQMDQGLDTGAMITKETVAITGATTSATLHDDLAALGGRMIGDVLKKLEAGEKLPLEIQNDEDFVYAPMLKKEDGIVKWMNPAAMIDRQVRALNPWPGVWTHNKGQRIKMLEVQVCDNERPDIIEAGTIINRDGDVVCGDGKIIRLKTIQPEGKKPMDFSAAMNGGYIAAGDVLV